MRLIFLSKVIICLGLSCKRAPLLNGGWADGLYWYKPARYILLRVLNFILFQRWHYLHFKFSIIATTILKLIFNTFYLPRLLALLSNFELRCVKKRICSSLIKLIVKLKGVVQGRVVRVHCWPHWVVSWVSVHRYLVVQVLIVVKMVVYRNYTFLWCFILFRRILYGLWGALVACEIETNFV